MIDTNKRTDRRKSVERKFRSETRLSAKNVKMNSPSRQEAADYSIFKRKTTRITAGVFVENFKQVFKPSYR